MRSYLVIPAGTPVVQVDASTPHSASSKARRGRDATHVVSAELVLAQSRSVEPRSSWTGVIPGQLELAEPTAVGGADGDDGV
jgi:hypothetical protein